MSEFKETTASAGPSKNAVVSVFVEQDILKSEKEAKSKLRSARKAEGCVGGRVIKTGRSRQTRWIVQTFFQDDGGTPPTGMARLIIPADQAGDAETEYGLEPTKH